MPVRGGAMIRPALAETDGGEDVDNPCCQLCGVMFQLQDRLRIQGSGIVKTNFVDVLFRRTPFDGLDLIEDPAARKAGQEQAWTQTHFADELAGDKQIATCRPKRKGRIAKLTVLTLVGEL